MNRFRQLAYCSLGLVVILACLRVRACVKGQQGDSGASSTTGATHPSLSPKDKEAVSYNSDTHMLTVQTSTSVQKVYTRNPVVHVQRDGGVKIDRNLLGLEFSPFAGMGYGGGSRLYLGAGFVRAWRFDLNAQLAVSLDRHTPRAVEPVVSLSFNFWRDTSVFVGTDPVTLLLQKPVYHAGLLVRF